MWVEHLGPCLFVWSAARPLPFRCVLMGWGCPGFGRC
nr:MAG TPA: hypothetical protein [Caudoviricetes sp.]